MAIVENTININIKDQEHFVNFINKAKELMESATTAEKLSPKLKVITVDDLKAIVDNYLTSK